MIKAELFLRRVRPAVEAFQITAARPAWPEWARQHPAIYAMLGGRYVVDHYKTGPKVIGANDWLVRDEGGTIRGYTQAQFESIFVQAVVTAA